MKGHKEKLKKNEKLVNGLRTVLVRPRIDGEGLYFFDRRFTPLTRPVDDVDDHAPMVRQNVTDYLGNLVVPFNRSPRRILHKGQCEFVQQVDQLFRACVEPADAVPFGDESIPVGLHPNRLLHVQVDDANLCSPRSLCPTALRVLFRLSGEDN